MAAQTVGSKIFVPDKFFEDWSVEKLPKNNDFRAAIRESFGLLEKDDYVYHAHSSFTLDQVQQAVDAGDANGLTRWYFDQHGDEVRGLISYLNRAASFLLRKVIFKLNFRISCMS
jgi:hypothetical protein